MRVLALVRGGVVLFVILAAARASAAELTTLRCVGVTTHGGDTVEALCDTGGAGVFHGSTKVIHLRGVACPDPEQPYGERAARFVMDQMGRAIVQVKVFRVDPNGSVWGEVLLPDGRALSGEILLAGLGWWDWQHSDDQGLGYLEQRAQSQQLGLWKDPNPVPPWEYHKSRLAAAVPAPRPPQHKTLDDDARRRWMPYAEILLGTAALGLLGLLIARKVNPDYTELNFVPIVAVMSAGYVLLAVLMVLAALSRI